MNNKIVDVKDALDRILDDKELLIELLEDFEKDYSSKRKLLEEAIAQKNYEKIKDIAHSVKGSAGNVSIKSMHTCYMLIEYLAENEDLKLIEELLVDIDQQFLELKTFCSQLRKEFTK